MKNKHNFNPDLLDELFEKDVLKTVNIQPKNIKRHVRNTLNKDKAEEEIFMRYQLTRLAILVVSLFSIGTMTIYAATQLDILRDIFSGDTELIQDYIYTAPESLENGQLRVTVEQAISDHYSIMVIYSVEALTTEGGDMLNQDGLMANYDVIIDFPDVNQDPYHSSIVQGNLAEYDTPGKKYYWIRVDGVDGLPDNGCIRTSILGPEYLEASIPVPQANRLDRYDFTIDRMVNSIYHYKIYNVGFSSISLVVSFDTDQNAQPDTWGLEDPEIFFRHTDGHIVTKNQLIDIYSRAGAGDGHNSAYYYRFAKPVDWDEYTSVIVADMEYPIHGGEPKPFKIPDGLKSFLFKPDMNEDGLLRCPLEEFCRALGAEYQFDEVNNELFISWRNTTFKTIIGSEVCLINGTETPFDPKALDMKVVDGRVTSTGQLFVDVFNLGIEWIAFHETDLDAQRLWLVTP